MDWDALQHRLFAAARAHASSERVPDFFASRVMARLRATPGLDAWTWWGRAMWRAAAAWIVVAVVTGALSWGKLRAQPSADDLVQELNQALLASVEDAEVTW